MAKVGDDPIQVRPGLGIREDEPAVVERRRPVLEGYEVSLESKRLGEAGRHPQLGYGKAVTQNLALPIEVGERVGLHVFVSGVVHGVAFRSWTRRMAQELGLDGWARNLNDGRVEIRLEGDRARIDEYLHRAHRGPKNAHVTKVEFRLLDDAGLEGFDVRADA